MAYWPEYPYPTGTLEISIKDGREVVIAGDPEGLRSLAKLLEAMADVDQEVMGLTIGEREHLHLHAGSHLAGPLSVETEICRLDAKGTGEFPAYFKKPKRPRLK